MFRHLFLSNRDTILRSYENSIHNNNLRFITIKHMMQYQNLILTIAVFINEYIERQILFSQRGFPLCKRLPLGIIVGLKIVIRLIVRILVFQNLYLKSNIQNLIKSSEKLMKNKYVTAFLLLEKQITSSISNRICMTLFDWIKQRKRQNGGGEQKIWKMEFPI